MPKTYTSATRDLTIPDWPHGRRRVEARFYIETARGGERVCRVTTGKPKKTTISPRCAIVTGDDDRTYILQSTAYGFVMVTQGNMKTEEETIWPKDAERYAIAWELLDEVAL